MMKRCRLLLTMLLAAFVISCATASHEMGRKFDISSVDNIQIGKTTEAEVISLLGEPLKKEIRPDDTKVYGYGHLQSKATVVAFTGKGRVTGEKAIITFDKNGIVSGIDRRVLPGE
jgi:hypothetical protein